MCTSLIVNKKKTIVGWNLDMGNMEHRVRPTAEGVYIEALDAKEGWMPLFGANSRGDFVGMPTCWPADARSNPKPDGPIVIMLDIDLLMQKKTLQEVRAIAENGPVYSVPGLTFMASLSDKDGNVLQIVPGQGAQYFEKPEYKILTNFSPYKQDSEQHPWMGWDRYQTADAMLKNATQDFDVPDMFAVLKAVSQTACPTVVSMVYDVTERKVYWCEDRGYDRISMFSFEDGTLIRPEREEDYREVETLVRESFWNVYQPGCMEHFVLKNLRNDPDFVKELDYVMEKDGKIIGQNIFVRTEIPTDDGRKIPIMTMGPICITPELKRKGYGKKLLDFTLMRAKELGCGALCFEGNI